MNNTLKTGKGESELASSTKQRKIPLRHNGAKNILFGTLAPVPGKSLCRDTLGKPIESAA